MVKTVYSRPNNKKHLWIRLWVVDDKCETSQEDKPKVFFSGNWAGGRFRYHKHMKKIVKFDGHLTRTMVLEEPFTTPKPDCLPEFLFSVFMWLHHIPKLKITFPSEISVPSDKRLYRTLTSQNVLAQQGSSFCNRARLYFQAFALRDTKVAAQEGCRVVKRWVIALVFAN